MTRMNADGVQELYVNRLTIQVRVLSETSAPSTEELVLVLDRCWIDEAELKAAILAIAGSRSFALTWQGGTRNWGASGSGWEALLEVGMDAAQGMAARAALVAGLRRVKKIIQDRSEDVEAVHLTADEVAARALPRAATLWGLPEADLRCVGTSIDAGGLRGYAVFQCPPSAITYRVHFELLDGLALYTKGARES